jgi:glycine C-acetyltransferase
VANELLTFLQKENTNLEHAGLFKQELALDRKPLINLATNDYLGLAAHPLVKQAAVEMIGQHGSSFGAPRMLAGTRTLHAELEQAITRYLGTEDTVLFSSRYHANTGLFESIFDDRDWIFCDDSAHPSLADGIRLSKARAVAFHNQDMDHLEDRLKRSRAARFRAIVTDGVFPLDGRSAKLGDIASLASKYDAQVFVDDSAGIGVLGRRGRGSVETPGGDVDLITGTLTHAFGAGSGGFASGRSALVAWLRQKSRSYLSSTAPPPASVGAALAAVHLLDRDLSLVQTLRTKVQMVRESLAAHGYEVIPAEHPIVVLMIGHAVATQRTVDAIFQRGVYTVGFCHPVVPEGAARIRLQVSLHHRHEELQTALRVFDEVKRLRMRERG